MCESQIGQEQELESKNLEFECEYCCFLLVFGEFVVFTKIFDIAVRQMPIWAIHNMD